jgi:glucose-6-phosphate isomerase
MKYSKQQLWQRFQKYSFHFPSIGFALDLSRVNFPDDFFDTIKPRMDKAFADMNALERGAIANPDEDRMVGHYWLRNPALAPTAEIRYEIDQAVASIKAFVSKVHTGAVRGKAGNFSRILLIGIGGSALGPQFVSSALGHPGKDRLTLHCFDNTDPDGMDRVLDQIGADLGRTLVIVISKSGGTKETQNGMLEAEAAYKKWGLDFFQHAVVVTSKGSALDTPNQPWLARFPMWDWVGGRTSELSAVGLLPAALQGFDIDSMLAGAKACDELTRRPEIQSNPAALLSLMWLYAGNGRGDKNMIILPYKDRLELFSKYLQQLVMESLGKEFDLEKRRVEQGITVFGNKGSTDQHAYVQQLRDGRNDFFVTFIEVRKDRQGPSVPVDPDVTAGDYLLGFYLGTRSALYEKDRESITLTITDVAPAQIGALIALFERAVGFYASLVGINAYHQPGVEAGKKAATEVLKLQKALLNLLTTSPDQAFTAEAAAAKLGTPDEAETLLKIAEHLASNSGRHVKRLPGEHPFTASYQYQP